jgi:hypothetical protein
MSTLSKNILATVAYYDVFEYPLTLFELWQYLLNQFPEDRGSDARVSLDDVMKALETEVLQKNIENFQGMSFLRGRKKLVRQRLLREKLSLNKMKGVSRVVFWLRFIPFVRMIALTGSLAMKNSTSLGDWDLLIVLRKGHIWTGRFLVTGLLWLFDKKRHDEEVADRVCLNYWITSSSLEIMTKDLFSSHEYFFCVPLFGFATFQKFRASNQWIRRFRPQYRVPMNAHLGCQEDDLITRWVRSSWEIFLSDEWIEYKLSKWQYEKIMCNPKTHLMGSFIEANDAMLIFLPQPQGPRVFDAFKQRLSEMHYEG